MERHHLLYELRWRFLNLKLSDFDTAAELSTALQFARHEILRLDPRANIPPSMLVHRFLHGLGPSFEAFRSVFFADGATPTIEEATRAAELDERIQRTRAREEPRRGVLSASRSRVQCAHCRMVGHRADACLMRQAERKRKSGLNTGVPAWGKRQRMEGMDEVAVQS